MVSIDGLRGLAALSVVAFHYTSWYGELYAEDSSRSVVDWSYGRYGVHLFFIISGFVIFETSQRCERLRDFVLSRVLRLFPLYWACVLITWTVVTAFGPDDRAVSAIDMLVNLTMFHSWFGTPHVDGVYWTLAVEMSFYFIIAAAMAAKSLQGRRLVLLLSTWLVASRLLHVDVLGQIPGHHYLQMLLAADYSHLFIAGICLHVGWRDRHTPWTIAGLSACLVVAVLEGGAYEGAVTLGLVLVLVGAVHGWFGVLSWKPLQVLGLSSYALYLIHQNIGYAALSSLEKDLETPASLSVMVVMMCAVAVAHVLTTYWDEPIRKSLTRRACLRHYVRPAGRTESRYGNAHRRSRDASNTL
ncbi:acyltransferase family protein [Blastococcus sp. SYSU DS1021]